MKMIMELLGPDNEITDTSNFHYHNGIFPVIFDNENYWAITKLLGKG